MSVKINKMSARLRGAILAMALAIVCAMSFGTAAWAGELPNPMTPARLVNDFAGLMDEQSKAALEDSLVRFANHTSTQVTVVTVSDLSGYDIAQYAQELAEKWGVGQKGKDNGVIILVKPKTDDSRGQAFIGTGYGAEGALPDVTCMRIVNEKMIPFFKEGNYSGGIRVGALAVMQALSGEFEADEEEGIDDSVLFAMTLLFFIIIFLVLSSADDNGNGGGRHITRSSGDEWLAASILGSGLSGRSSGGWSGGGGFGGFGGGSFGGGGGGGSW